MGTVGCHVLLEEGSTRSPSSRDPNELRLFSKCRNERLRLPAFLHHYRKLGVRRFFIVDNGSTDDSLPYLAAQSDVHVFRTQGSFREARGGTDWLNALLKAFGIGGWCVTVDMDELLWYPGSESAPLQQFTAYLDAQGKQALFCMLLDMYPGGKLRDAVYVEGTDLIEAAPFFDPGPYERVPGQQCPDVLVYGGVRERVFYPEAHTPNLKRNLHVSLYHRVLPKLRKLSKVPFVHEHRPLFPPCLTKVPLVRWESDTEYLNVNHFVSPRKEALESGVLLHFKLMQDFHARAGQEAARGQYFDGAVEYRRYAETLRSDPEMTLRYEGSRRLESTQQLVELGLLRDTPQWRSARTNQAAAVSL